MLLNQSANHPGEEASRVGAGGNLYNGIVGVNPMMPGGRIAFGTAQGTGAQSNDDAVKAVNPLRVRGRTGRHANRKVTAGGYQNALAILDPRARTSTAKQNRLSRLASQGLM